MTSGLNSIDSRELERFRDGLNEMKEIQDIVDNKEDAYPKLKTHI